MEKVKHNSGILKQRNKPHKHGSHKSKGELLKQMRGKVDVKTLSKKSKEINKSERKNRINQLRKAKRDEILSKKRSIGGTVPHIVSIIPLSSDVNCRDILEKLINCEIDANWVMKDNDLCYLQSIKHKRKFQFITPNKNILNAVLDAVMISDTCIFGVSKEVCIDDSGMELYNTIYSVHLPTNVFVVQGLDVRRSSMKTDLEKTIETKCSKSKLYALDSTIDALSLLHKISEHKINEMQYCSMRPHLLPDKIEFIKDKDNADSGTLKICGYLRGKNLNANNLIYIPTLGTYQIEQIDVARCSSNQNNEEVIEWKCISRFDSEKAESLAMEQEQSLWNSEQTWPTSQEIKESQNIVLKKVAKGTSDYQATWILDSDNEDDSKFDDNDNVIDEENNDNSNTDNSSKNDSENEKDDFLMDDAENECEKQNQRTNENYDNTVNLIEEKSTLEKIRLSRLNENFPDEIDTPLNIPAKKRFQKYRGLSSFRTSPWDPYENLPTDYSKIYQFENINRTYKKVLDEECDGAEVGWYIRIHISGVSNLNIIPNYPLILFGLLRYENKMSVINLKLKRINYSEDDLPIKSKDKLYFRMGARRFSAGPLFSQNSSGNKHKLERYMPIEGTFVATLFGPITYWPASILVFKELENGTSKLVASGVVMSIDPNRVIVKRIVLSGHPYRVNKRNAVVRFMFFNSDDVNWFKPVELRTNSGKRGHIKEALGTHGHMKCQFNGIIKSQDTVLMNLYKRVYPKWTYEELSCDFTKYKNLEI